MLILDFMFISFWELSCELVTEIQLLHEFVGGLLRPGVQEHATKSCSCLHDRLMSTQGLKFQAGNVPRVEVQGP